jgi:hypothetical protein
MKRSSTLAVAAAAALGTACGGTPLSSPLEQDPDASKIVQEAGGAEAGDAESRPCPREHCPDSGAAPAPAPLDAGVDSAAPPFDATDDTMGGYQAYGVPVPFDAAMPPPPDDAGGEDAGEDVMGGGVDYGIPFPPDAGPHP